MNFLTKTAMSKRKRHPGPAPTKAPASRIRQSWQLAAVLIVLCALGVVFLLSRQRAPDRAAADVATNTVTTSQNPPTTTNDVPRSRLIGRWRRPDGGYILEIRGAEADGKLDAAYFNPRPINVAKAEWKRADARLQVFIELRDVNYPGATYKLAFLDDRDTFVGEYHQPLVQQTFEVQFTRQ